MVKLFGGNARGYVCVLCYILNLYLRRRRTVGAEGCIYKQACSRFDVTERWKLMACAVCITALTLFGLNLRPYYWQLGAQVHAGRRPGWSYTGRAVFRQE